MKFKIHLKIFAAIFLVFIFVLGVGAFIGVSSATKIYSQAVLDKELVVGRNLALQLDRLLKLGLPLDQIEGFNEQCQEIIKKHPEATAAMVVDTNSQIIFHSDPSKVGELINFAEITRGVESATEKTVIHQQGNLSHYIAIVPLFDSNQNHIGAVLLEVPSEIVTRKQKELTSIFIIASTSSFIAASIVLFIILSFWITKPINSLLKTMRDIIQTGDLTKRVIIKSSDEIGELASTFDQMTSQLQQSYQVLEQRVKERTAELEEANKKVEKVNMELEGKVTELERMNKLMVGRELKMVELKKEIEELRKKVKT